MFSHCNSGGTGVIPCKGEQLRGVNIVNYYSSFRSKAITQKQFRSEFTLRFLFAFCRFTFTDDCGYNLWVLPFPDKNVSNSLEYFCNTYIFTRKYLQICQPHLLGALRYQHCVQCMCCV